MIRCTAPYNLSYILNYTDMKKKSEIIVDGISEWTVIRILPSMYVCMYNKACDYEFYQSFFKGYFLSRFFGLSNLLMRSHCICYKVFCLLLLLAKFLHNMHCVLKAKMAFIMLKIMLYILRIFHKFFWINFM